MFQQQDKAHIEAMNKIQERMGTPGEMGKWIASKRIEFEALPES